MKIEIIPNPVKDRGHICTERLLSLLSDCGCEVYMPQTAEVRSTAMISGEFCTGVPDMIIVLGGDGSIMRASHRAAALGVPILGINLGRVGYLAEIEPAEIELLRSVFENGYTVERRLMLDVRHIRGDRTVVSGIALNDAVVSHGSQPKFMESEIFCNGSSIGKCRSDGYIFSTPTGSTAYSLSAGGPVLDPSLRGMCLIPICPYSLTSRPIVVPDTTVAELRYISGGGAYLTVDGSGTDELLPGDTVRITASALTADFVRVKREHNRNFYRIFRDKMSDS